MVKTCSTSIPQLNNPRGNENHSLQLSLPLEKRRKPQIAAVPGQRGLYQVTFNGEILASDLTSDEAFELAKNPRSGKIAQLPKGGTANG